MPNCFGLLCFILYANMLFTFDRHHNYMTIIHYQPRSTATSSHHPPLITTKHHTQPIITHLNPSTSFHVWGTRNTKATPGCRRIDRAPMPLTSWRVVSSPVPWDAVELWNCPWLEARINLKKWRPWWQRMGEGDIQLYNVRFKHWSTTKTIKTQRYPPYNWLRNSICYEIWSFFVLNHLKCFNRCPTIFWSLSSSGR